MKKNVLLLLLLVLGVRGSVRVAAAGDCAPLQMMPVLATADGAELPPDGGLVIADELSSNQLPKPGQVTPNGPLEDLRFVDGKRRTAPSVKAVAPGLVVLQAVGTRLEDKRRNKLLTFTRATTAQPAIEAPKATAVVRTTSWPGRKRFQSVSVQLAAAAPADRYLVVFDHTGKIGRSWGRGDGSATTVIVYRSGECTTVPDGTHPSAPGDEVRLAWLDRTGRMSALSPAIKIAEITPAGPLGDY